MKILGEVRKRDSVSRAVPEGDIQPPVTLSRHRERPSFARITEAWLDLPQTAVRWSAIENLTAKAQRTAELLSGPLDSAQSFFGRGWSLQSLCVFAPLRSSPAAG
jgi:hypothetical protein